MPKSLALPGRVLSWDKSQPGGELAALMKGRSVADCGDDRGRNQGPMPGICLSRWRLEERAVAFAGEGTECGNQ